MVDVVTNRQANLHAEIMALLGREVKNEPDLYAVAYRPVVREEQDLIEVWPEPLAIGGDLPTLPLALNAETCVPIDLDASYSAACSRRRLP